MAFLYLQKNCGSLDMHICWTAKKHSVQLKFVSTSKLKKKCYWGTYLYNIFSVQKSFSLSNLGRMIKYATYKHTKVAGTGLIKVKRPFAWFTWGYNYKLHCHCYMKKTDRHIYEELLEMCCWYQKLEWVCCWWSHTSWPLKF